MSKATIDPTQISSNPQQRNWHWRAIQAALQLFFPVWLGYRAWGMHRLEGLDGALLVANHQSFADPLLAALPLKRPVSYLARDSLFRVPVVGYILRNTYVMPISREAASTSSLREAIRRMDAGYLVGIFPEGTRTTDGAVGEFKPGFVSLARRSKRPLVPVGIAGAYQAYPRGSLFPRPGQVRVTYGRPITPEQIAAFGRDDAALVAFIRSQVEACARLAATWRDTGRLPTDDDPPITTNPAPSSNHAEETVS